MKFKKISVIISSIILAISVILISSHILTINAEPESREIKITYNTGSLIDENGNDIIDEIDDNNKTYYKELQRVQLADYTNDIWNDITATAISKAKIIDNVEGNDVSYEAAFAGWKLKSINDNPVSGDYFYPDHDYIYFNDEPFVSYETNSGEITSLEFSALWGKTVYVRDKYDFNDITNVYKGFATDYAGNTVPARQVAKISWNEGTVNSYHLGEGYYDAGSSSSKPVASIFEANKLLGKLGGKLVIVNHYTIEPNAFAVNASGDTYANNYSAFESAYTNGALNYYEVIGNFDSTGVLTVTGEGFGMKDLNEKKLDTVGITNNKYDNSYLYFRNSKGNGTYNGTNYAGLTVHARFASHTVLDSINIVGYRESYNINGGDGSRHTNEVYMYTTGDSRFVVEKSTDIYKRSTAYKNLGIDTTNWSHTAITRNDKDDSGEDKNKTFAALGAGGGSYLFLFAGHNSSDGMNIYITLYGNYSTESNDAYYRVCIFSRLKQTNTKYYTALPAATYDMAYNNIHISFDDVYLNTFYGFNGSMNKENYIWEAKNYEIYFNNVHASKLDTVYNCRNANIENLNIVIDGPQSNSRTITEFYIGGTCNDNQSRVSNVNIDNINFYVKGSKISHLYGGGSTLFGLNTYGNLNFYITGGYVTNLYGGGLGGFVTTTEGITFNVDGGKIDYLYGGGAGGIADVYESNGPRNLTGYSHVVNDKDGNYNYFVDSSNNGTFHGMVYSLETYEFNRKNSEGIMETAVYELIRLNCLNTSTPSKFTSYYNTLNTICVSEAVVTSDVTINISDGTINKDVYGGGKDGALVGDIDINITGGRIKGNVYAGGQGMTTSYNSSKVLAAGKTDVEFLLTSNKNALTVDKYQDLFANGDISTTHYTEALSYFNNGKFTKSLYTDELLQFFPEYQYGVNSSNGKPIIEVYTSIIEKLGLIDGNTNIKISGGIVDGNVFGGSNGEVASITGSSNISITGGTINKSVYGGGNKAFVSNNSTVSVTGGTVKGTVFGGGNEAAVKGNSTVTIENVTLKDVYGAGNLAVVEGDILVNVSNATISNMYAGANQADINGDVVIYIDKSTLPNIFGGNNIKGNIAGSINIYVDKKGLGKSTITNLYGGGNLASYTGTTTIEHNLANTTNLYGGGLSASVNESNITINSGKVTSLFGGGYAGHIDTATNILVNGGTFDTIYGGGYNGNVNGSATIVINDGTMNNVYGGGYQGNIYGNAQSVYSLTNKGVYIYGGTVNNNVYGGGYAGTVDVSNVTISGNNAIVNGVVFGGGNLGNNTNDSYVNIIEGASVANVYGGANEAIVNGNINVTVDSSKVTNTLFGGGNMGATKGNVAVSVLENSSIKNLYGGANEADVDGIITVNVDSSTISNTLIGGGNLGNSYNNVNVNVTNNSTIKTLYGGANKANVEGNINVNVFSSTITDEFFGGNNISGNISGTITNVLTMSNLNNVYGGGNEATYSSNITPITLLINGSTINNIYGGGKNANVVDTQIVAVNNPTLTNVYGGGYQGNVANTAIYINSGTITNNVYGGGYAGTATSTNVTIDDSDYSSNPYGLSVTKGLINIYGDVFGGGEGATATITDSTNVVIDMDLSFTATETEIDTGTITSGKTNTELDFDGSYSKINGSVYGGGDLGQVGTGTIVLATNTANNVSPGNSSVTVNNGYIAGSVFGGGNGVPGSGISYTLYMGTVFGYTKTNIYGGYIGLNVYGGGRQSRLYFNNSKNIGINYAAEVTIHELSDRSIAINGSVFGGGDRGSENSQNASVPTTVGNVKVGIYAENDSNIYFLTGGIYGDGNLCLVNGTRDIIIENFNKGNNKGLKTFYSLQRADNVTLHNSEFVLLGAVDLVEEGDTTIYSINRIDKLTLSEGSIVKLDKIVKYLGMLESDIDTSREFIDNGNNGDNNYTSEGGNPSHPLTDEEILKYQEDLYTPIYEQSTVNGRKNVVCVANGLYLEIIQEDNNYGNVFGLFTLQLLVATPGEGGGFVYSAVTGTTGTFICETVKYAYVSTPTVENLSSYYVLNGAGEYVKTNDSSIDPNKEYYEAIYMDVVGNVIDYNSEKDKYERYCWYILGDTMFFELSLTGYIGATETSFAESRYIPTHEDELLYTLKTLSLNDTLINAVSQTNPPYDLVTKSTGLTGQEIALELVLSYKSFDSLTNDYIVNQQSIGFLDYYNSEFSIVNGSVRATGYTSQAEILNNILFTFTSKNYVDTSISFILHKSVEVNTELSGMEIGIEFALVDEHYKGYSKGTAFLNFDINLAILRLVPTQVSYSSPYKSYSGVTSSSSIQITGQSSFTMQYQTRYIPNAFLYIDGYREMSWIISTKQYKYYVDNFGNYFTLDEYDNCVNIPASLSFTPNEIDNGVPGNIYYDGSYYHYIDGNKTQFTLFSSTSSSKLPAGTKITMIDISVVTNKQYYYYICDSETDEIDVNSFMQMGSNIKISDMANRPTFMNLYYQKGSARITEEVIFIFDFAQAKWDSGNTLFSGDVTFQHMYNNVDIMDYVKTEVDGDVTSYIRYNPISTRYTVDTSKDGIDSFTSIVEEDYYMLDEITIEVNVTESSDYINTQLIEGQYVVKIELNNGQALPEGVYAISNGKEYFPSKGNKYIIVPVNGNVKNYIRLVNFLEKFDSNEITFKSTLYNSPDELFVNETFNTITNDAHHITTDSFVVYDNPSYSLSIDVENRVIDNVFTFDIKTNAVGEQVSIGNAVVDFDVFKKNSRGVYELVDKYTLFDVCELVDNSTNNWRVNSRASGTYKIVFKYGNKEEYVNIVVK